VGLYGSFLNRAICSFQVTPELHDARFHGDREQNMPSRSLSAWPFPHLDKSGEPIAWWSLITESQMQQSGLPWVIILAGGEGTRMCPFTERCFGDPRPKQYCRFCGARSMLEKTVDRALALTNKEHTITVIGSDHRKYLGNKIPGQVLEQPRARGTAVGVFWPLAQVISRSHEAVVVIFPSDHFFYPEQQFVVQLRHAVDLAKANTNRIILVAAVADAPETDYGWIEPGQSAAFEETVPLRRVLSFHEKPSRTQAEKWLESGCLWNTMITVSSARALWHLGKELLPEVVHRVEAFWQVVEHEQALESLQAAAQLRKIYSQIPTRDFSSDFLTPAAGRSLVMPLEGVFWSDWGRPERLRQSLLKARTDFPDWVQSQDFRDLEEACRFV
jgi:mannose-1-phosphate guanylyltransferase